MARRRYLIAYDISDLQRPRRVITVMEANGRRLLYSVFLCDLSKQELLAWHRDITAVIATQQDSLVRIDLGPLGASAPIIVVGTPRTLPVTGPVVI